MTNNPVVSLFVKGSNPTDIRFSGTGVFIAPTIILTCQHVVATGKKWRAFVRSKHGDTLLNVEKVYSNAKYDFALLRTPEEIQFEFLKMYLGPPPLDQEVQIWCPHEQKSPFKGILRYTQCISEDQLEEVSYLITGASLKPGTSGSPVLFKNEILGMHYCIGVAKRNRHKSQCLPTKVIAEILAKEGHRWMTSND